MDSTQKEDLYDSLDEDFHSASEESLQEHAATVGKRLKKKYREPNEKTCDNSTDVSALVPLYLGEAKKSDVLVNKKTNRPIRKSNIPIRVPSNGQIVPDSVYKYFPAEKPTVCLDGGHTFPKLMPKKSYTSIYRARVGFPEGMKTVNASDTARTVCGDSTGRSVSSAECSVIADFENCCKTDSDSFYLEHIRKSERADVESSNFPFRLPLESFRSSCERFSFRSSSDNDVRGKFAKAQSTIKGKKSSPLVKVLPLGRLGPDHAAIRDKLENLNKQQSYGIRASLNNRIKLKETKLLQCIKRDDKSITLENK